MLSLTVSLECMVGNFFTQNLKLFSLARLLTWFWSHCVLFHEVVVKFFIKLRQCFDDFICFFFRECVHCWHLFYEAIELSILIIIMCVILCLFEKTLIFISFLSPGRLLWHRWGLNLFGCEFGIDFLFELRFFAISLFKEHSLLLGCWCFLLLIFDGFVGLDLLREMSKWHWLEL